MKVALPVFPRSFNFAVLFQSEETVFAVLIRVGEHNLLVPTNQEDAVTLNGSLTEAAIISDGDCIQCKENKFEF